MIISEIRGKYFKMAQHNETGKKGEQLAVELLISKGYTIRHTNWRSQYLEVDIIATKNNLLVFIEVKSRNTLYFGNPEEFVSKKKEKNLINAAEIYVTENQLDLEVRFDLISIIFLETETKIEHIEDAFFSEL